MESPVVIVFLLLLAAAHTAFLVWHTKTMWGELRRMRRERALHPNPHRRRDVIRALLITTGFYGGLGLAFYLGWRQAGVGGGVFTAAAVAAIGMLVAAAFGIKSAWVSRE